MLCQHICLQQILGFINLNINDFYCLGSLTDVHIWKLAERITNEQQLNDLGIKVLKIRDFKIQSALTDKKSINLAAHRVLQTWVSGQNNRCDAYTNLVSGLRSNAFNALAGELTRWVEGTQ